MAEFLIYQGKAAIALAVFYIFCRLLLSKETFHRFNRIVLLGTATLSFVVPDDSEVKETGIFRLSLFRLSHSRKRKTTGVLR